MGDLLEQYRKTLRNLVKHLASGRFKGRDADLVRDMIRDVTWVIRYMLLGSPMRRRAIRVPKERRLPTGPRQSITRRARWKRLQQAAVDLRNRLAAYTSLEEARRAVLTQLERHLTRREFALLCWIAQGLSEEEMAELLRLSRPETEEFIERTLSRAAEALDPVQTTHSQDYPQDYHQDYPQEGA